MIRRVQREVPFSFPPFDDPEWRKASREWLSIRTVKLDKNLVFTVGTINVSSLFADTVSPHLPHLVRYNGELYVLSGETTIVQCALTGRAGLDVLVLDR